MRLIRQHTSAYVSIRQHQSNLYISIRLRQHKSAYVRVRRILVLASVQIRVPGRTFLSMCSQFTCFTSTKVQTISLLASLDSGPRPHLAEHVFVDFRGASGKVGHYVHVHLEARLFEQLDSLLALLRYSVYLLY
jgi:hypothetical protein